MPVKEKEATDLAGQFVFIHVCSCSIYLTFISDQIGGGDLSGNK